MLNINEADSIKMDNKISQTKTQKKEVWLIFPEES
jgi:hypothetical protein